MSNSGSSLIYLSFVVILFLGLTAVTPASATGNTYIYTQCSNRTSTSSTPQYQSNVNVLLDYFIASAGSEYNYGKFKTDPPEDGVYGLYQCRGDLASSNCKGCVTQAVNHLKTACPMSTRGQVQLEGCFVRFDNTSFFGAHDKREMFRRCGPASVGENRSDVLKRRDAALDYLVIGGNTQYFRAGGFGSVKGVAQCVQDLSLSDCHDCVREASRRLRSECEDSSRGEMYLGKCYLGYVDGGDNDNKNTADNDDDGYSSSTAGGSGGGSGGGRKNNMGKLIGIIAAIIISVAAVGGLVLKLRNSCNNNGICYCCYCCNENQGLLNQMG